MWLQFYFYSTRRDGGGGGGELGAAARWGLQCDGSPTSSSYCTLQLPPDVRLKAAAQAWQLRVHLSALLLSCLKRQLTGRTTRQQGRSKADLMAQSVCVWPPAEPLQMHIIAWGDRLFATFIQPLWWQLWGSWSLIETLSLSMEMGQRHPAEPQKQPTRAVSRGSPEQGWVQAQWDAQRSRGERRFPTVRVCWVHFDMGWVVRNHLTARSRQRRCPERHSNPFVPNSTCDTQRPATFHEVHSLFVAHVIMLATESFKSQANAAR